MIESEEGPALGGAMLAAVPADGTFASCGRSGCEKLVKVVETVEPDPEIAEKYETQYRKFVQIYPTVKALFPKLS